MPEVRYDYEMGWLQVWDPFDHVWLKVRKDDCPPSWRRAAHLEKERRRGTSAPSPARSVSRQTVRGYANEEEYAF